MARRKADAPVPLDAPHELTAGLIEALKCPVGKEQAFLRDTKALGLRVRVTRAGAKAFVFESKVNGKTLRRTIGSPSAWSIDAARIEANRLRVLVDQKTDPRELDRQAAMRKSLQQDVDAAAQAQEAARALLVGDVWPTYLAEGKPRRKAAWKPRYRADLEKAASLGGEAKKRGQGKTKAGHLAALMPLTLASIDQDTIRDWYASNAKGSPINAARAVAMFSGFLGWCATRKELRGLVEKNAARASDLGDMLPPKNDARKDAVEIAQLPAWFAGTNKLRSHTAAAYLQALVLTGARREELAGLRWADVDFRWLKLTIADKVDATRTIPLTPYMAWLLAGLPRVKFKSGKPNPFVFSSNLSACGRIVEPRAPHADVLADAGIPHVSIHGLRRTFSLLGEAAGAPAGAIAQVMGHKPSAVAEGYRPRSIDALRPYLALIERFILDKAEVVIDPAEATGNGLRLVGAAAA